ncbi:MAG: hypothetical protein WD361_13525 [Gracilimonas sp.]
MDWLKYKYWVIEETTYEEEIPDSEKMSTKGVLIFCLYSLLAIAGFIFLEFTIDASSLRPSVYAIGAIIYMMLVIGGAFFLISKFTGKQETESSQ